MSCVFNVSLLSYKRASDANWFCTVSFTQKLGIYLTLNVFHKYHLL